MGIRSTVCDGVGRYGGMVDDNNNNNNAQDGRNTRHYVVVDCLDDDGDDDSCPAGPFLYLGLLATAEHSNPYMRCVCAWCGKCRLFTLPPSHQSKVLLSPRKCVPLWQKAGAEFPFSLSALTSREGRSIHHWGRGPVCPPRSTTLDASHSRAPVAADPFRDF